MSELSDLLYAANDAADANGGDLESAAQSAIAALNQQAGIAPKEEPQKPDVATLPQKAPEAKTEPEPEPEAKADAENAEQAAQEEEPADEPQESLEDRLFNQFRKEFPGESVAKTAQRVQAAIGETEQQDIAQAAAEYFGALQQEYGETIEALNKAAAALDDIEKQAQESGAILDFKDVRPLYEAKVAAEQEAKAAYQSIQGNAFKQVEAEFPELTNPDHPATKLFGELVLAAAATNSKFDANDPTLAPQMARRAAEQARQLIPAQAEPKPAVPARKQAQGPKAPVAALPSAVQAKNALVGTPPNGPAQPLSLAEQVLAAAAQGKSLNDVFEAQNGGPVWGGTFR